MPSSYTPNYQLNQWAAGDQVLREDFNADNEKVDAAIRAVDQKAASKAEQTALEALQTAVAGKAEQTALAALQSTVSGLSASKADQSGLDALEQTVADLSASTAAALAKKGNLRVETGSYLGTGTAGSQTPTSLTFAARPLLVVVAGEDANLMLLSGQTASGQSSFVWGSYACFFTWEGGTVSWYDTHGMRNVQMNEQGRTYRYLALFQTE